MLLLRPKFFQTLRYSYPLIYAFFLCSWLFPSSSLLAQEPAEYPDDGSGFWQQIEAQLAKQPSDTSLYFIFEQVRAQCGTDLDCQRNSYLRIVPKFERGFKLFGALYIWDEIAKINHRRGDLYHEARAYLNLSRFHDALGNARLATLNLDKAIGLFEQLGSDYHVARAKMTRLERSVAFRPIEEVLPDMDALLEQAYSRKDTLLIHSMHNRMIDHALNAREFEQAARHIKAVEAIPISTPIQQNEYKHVIIAAEGRARLAQAQGKKQEAFRNYRKALGYCREEPSRWLEISILHDMATLVRSMGDEQLGYAYLDTALTKASALQLHDHLAEHYRIRTQWAEEEKRYADALAYLRNQQQQEDLFAARAADFDLEKHYLKLEKEQLFTAKRNRELELQLSKGQLRSFVAIAFLGILLASGLAYGMIRQRKRRDELAAQNQLIQRQAERLRNIDEVKSRFFANVSHELRTPLTLVLSPINNLLKQGELSSRQNRLLTRAQRNGRQLKKLVDQILDLTKLEMDKMELQLSPTPLAPFLRGHIQQFDSLAEQKKIALTCWLDIGELVSGEIDQEKLRQILYNLLGNAFKFTPEGGQITVQAGLVQEQLQLKVIDTGRGIRQEDLTHLFEPYFQSHSPGEMSEGGTGLGLSLCQKYVQLMGGSIDAQSTLGQGACFTLVIPMKLLKIDGMLSAKDWAPSIPTATTSLVNHRTDTPAPQQKGAGSTPTLLLVEDNQDLQDYIRELLQDQYQVLVANHGKEALELIHKNAHIDLVISDLMMPVMDGYQLLAQLRSQTETQSLPVIMLTARAGLEDRLKALRIGVDDYLVKPFEQDELLARVSNLVKRARVRKSEAQALALKAITSSPNSPSEDQEEDLAWLQRFEAIVIEESSNPDLSIPELAKRMATSESSLLRYLKRLTGLTPAKYLQEVRLENARRLLETEQFISVQALASAVGYREARTFTRSFKKRFGQAPSQLISQVDRG